MADDGSIVGIQEQSVEHWVPDIGYVHRIKVCNRTGTPKTVYVRSNPYKSAKDGKIEKTGEDTGEHLTIPANECKLVSFTFTHRPVQYYTDVYKSEDGEYDAGERYDYSVGFGPARIPTVICNASARPAHLNEALAIAYPRSLEASIGRPITLQVRAVRGLRAGWELSKTYPALGVPFELPPNEKSFPFRYEIAVHEPVPAQTITEVMFDVAVRGRKRLPPYAWSICVPFVHKWEPPELVTFTQRRHSKIPRLILRGQMLDAMGLLDAPFLRYSEDDGATWKLLGGKLTRIVEWGRFGIERADFEIQVPLKGRRARILASLTLRDTVGNELALPIDEYPQAKRRAPRERKPRRSSRPAARRSTTA